MKGACSSVGLELQAYTLAVPGSSPGMPIMNIEEFIRFQLDSDKEVGFESNRSNNLDDLIANTISITGELGEFANLVKKKLRKTKYGKTRLDEEDLDLDQELKEELIDVFIYFLKLCAILELDVEKEYLKKIKKGKK